MSSWAVCAGLCLACDGGREVPAFAGKTRLGAGMTCAGAWMT